jgi:hypothetical protein
MLLQQAQHIAQQQAAPNWRGLGTITRMTLLVVKYVHHKLGLFMRCTDKEVLLESRFRLSHLSGNALVRLGVGQ